MHATILKTLALVCSLIAITAASPAINERDLLEKRCGMKGCKARGGSKWCGDIGCDGLCLSGTDVCGTSACNTHFNNCKRSIEYDIALKAGKLVERADGVVERSVDADDFVAAVLNSMRDL